MKKPILILAFAIVITTLSILIGTIYVVSHTSSPTDDTTKVAVKNHNR